MKIAIKDGEKEQGQTRKLRFVPIKMLNPYKELRAI